MIRLAAGRIVLGVLTVFVSILIFIGTTILPGDVATAVLGQSATPDAVEAIRRSLQEVSDDKHSTWPRITLTLPFAMVMSIAAMAEAEERSMDDFILSCRPGAKRKLTGQEEALLVATACSRPPEGRARWTIELLGEMVRLTEHDSVSRETVRRRVSRCSSLPL